jgi:hypothetical protein
MNRAFVATIILLGAVSSAAAQTIPNQIWGKWVVRRVVPTSTISCWSEVEAKGIIGSEIEYAAASFRWKSVTVENPSAETAFITGEQFHDENSGRGRTSSQITFKQLGIKAAIATQISIKHPPANITSGTTGIPGDKVLVKDPNTIIFSVCGVYFEAGRAAPQNRPKRSP